MITLKDINKEDYTTYVGLLTEIQKDELIGNMPTEQVINFMATEKIDHSLNLLNFESSYNRAKDIFHF